MYKFCIVQKPNFQSDGITISVRPAIYAFRYMFFGLYSIFMNTTAVIGKNFH